MIAAHAGGKGQIFLRSCLVAAQKLAHAHNAESAGMAAAMSQALGGEREGLFKVLKAHGADGQRQCRIILRLRQRQERAQRPNGLSELSSAERAFGRSIKLGGRCSSRDIGLACLSEAGKLERCRRRAVPGFAPGRQKGAGIGWEQPGE